MTDRPITPFAPFAHNPDAPTVPPEAETHIPGPPGLPSEVRVPTTLPAPSQLDDISDRLAGLSDALFDPLGLLHTLFAGLEERNRLRHEETMRALTTIANGVAELSERVGRLEPEQEQHGARLTLLEGNGEAHAANGASE